MADEIVLEHQGEISTLTLNRPQSFNAINSAMASAFLTTINAVSARPETRVLIVQGAGKAFMAGGDVAQFEQAPETVLPEILEPMHNAMKALTELPIPVLASVRGAVAGAGLSLMLACDLVIASETCKVSFAYTKLGASCDLGCSWALPRVVGMRKALEIVLLAEPISADEAKTLGLINQLVADTELAERTQLLAQRLADSAPIALAELKQLLRQSHQRSFSAQLEAERQSFTKCLASQDFKEAVAGFLQKRPVHFKGI